MAARADLSNNEKIYMMLCIEKDSSACLYNFPGRAQVEALFFSPFRLLVLPTYLKFVAHSSSGQKYPVGVVIHHRAACLFHPNLLKLKLPTGSPTLTPTQLFHDTDETFTLL